MRESKLIKINQPVNELVSGCKLVSLIQTVISHFASTKHKARWSRPADRLYGWPRPRPIHLVEFSVAGADVAPVYTSNS